MEDTNLILIAQTLSTQLGRIADSLEDITKMLHNMPVEDKPKVNNSKEEYVPTYTESKTVSYDEFRRLAE